MKPEISIRVMPSPLGALRLYADDAALVAVLLPVQPELASATAAPAASRVLDATERQLAEYFAGTRRTFDLPIAMQGTRFQRTVWQQLVRIPFGELRSYGELAHALARPTASRAVGAANGCNVLSIVVPCHRVVAASGALTGYAGGLDAKRWLLAHEAAVVGTTPAQTSWI